MTNEELAIRIQAGEHLEDELWEQVRLLVMKTMRRWIPRDGSTNKYEFDDLVQAGYIGMIKAVKDFDPSSGYAFTTYMSRHLSNAARGVLGLRSEKRDPILKSVSLDQPSSSNPENDSCLKDTLPDPGQQCTFDDLVDSLADQEDTRAILEEVKKLKPINQEVIKEKFFDCLTFQAIGDRHEFCGRQRAQQIVNDSLRRLRNTRTCRMMRKERYIDQRTNFYAGKGLKAFNTTFSSAVEDIVDRRERIRHCYYKEQGIR